MPATDGTASDTYSEGADESALYPTLGLAMSGGGTRAAALAAGGLLRLNDSGALRRVQTISSVSGGSITNGFMSMIDLRNVDPESVENRLAELVWRLQKRPTLPLSKRAIGLTALLPLFILSHWFALGLAPFAALESWAWTILRLASPIGFWGFLLYRGTIIERRYRSQLFGDATLSEADHGEFAVQHVFCATDLRRGAPAYFLAGGSRGRPSFFVDEYDRSGAESTPIATVVRASSALPGGLPPRRYEDRLLADGGVWNNIGLQWFTTNRMVDAVLALDASSTLDELGPWMRRLYRVPLVAEILALARDFATMYRNSIASQHVASDNAWRTDLELGLDGRGTTPIEIASRSNELIDTKADVDSWYRYADAKRSERERLIALSSALTDARDGSGAGRDPSGPWPLGVSPDLAVEASDCLFGPLRPGGEVAESIRRYRKALSDLWKVVPPADRPEEAQPRDDRDLERLLERVASQTDPLWWFSLDTTSRDLLAPYHAWFSGSFDDAIAEAERRAREVEAELESAEERASRIGASLQRFLEEVQARCHNSELLLSASGGGIDVGTELCGPGEHEIEMLVAGGYVNATIAEAKAGYRCGRFDDESAEHAMATLRTDAQFQEFFDLVWSGDHVVARSNPIRRIRAATVEGVRKLMRAGRAQTGDGDVGRDAA